MAPHFEEPCITACSLQLVFGVRGFTEWLLWLNLEGIYLGGVDVGPNSETWLWVQSLIFFSLPRGVGFTLHNLTKDFLINHKADEWIDDGRKRPI